MSKKKLQEMGLKAKCWWTSALGILCIAIMIFLFIDPFSGCHIEDSYKIKFAEDVIESTYRYFDYLYVLQWIALGCLAFILWMWREKLGIDGLGPMHGSRDPHIETDLTSVPNEETPSIPEGRDSQTEAGTIPKSEPSPARTEVTPSATEIGDAQTAAGPTPESEPLPARTEVTPSATETRDAQTAPPSIFRNNHSASFVRPSKITRTKNDPNKSKAIQKSIATVFKKYKKISVENLAKSIQTPPNLVYQVLRTSRNLYRLDGIGIRSIVTPINSIENIVLNSIYEEISTNGSVQQYREAVVGTHKVDAIFRTRSDLYVVSLLNAKISKEKNAVGKEVSKLNKVSKQFDKVNRHLIIVFIGPIEEENKQDRREMILRHCSAITNLEIRFVNPQ